MGLLDSAKNLIKQAYDYVVGSDSDKKVTDAKKQNNNAQKASKVSNSPNSVYRPKGETVGAPVDVVEKKTNTQAGKTQKTQNTKQTQQTQTAKTVSEKNQPAQNNKSNKNNNNNNKPLVTQKDIDVKIASIKNKCSHLGLNFNDTKNNILKKINSSIEEYEQLNLEDKYRVLSCMDAALSMQLIYQDNEEFAPDIDKKEFLKEMAGNYYDLVENGGIVDIKAFQARIDYALDKAFKKYQTAKTDREKAEALNEAREDAKNCIAADMKAKKVGKSKAEKAKLDQQESVQVHAFEKGLSLGYTAKVKPEERKFGVYLVDGNYFDEAVENIINLSNDESKPIVADSLTHKFITDALEFKYNHDDYVPADVYGNAVEYSMQYKTAEAAQQFKQDAYEYRQKVENGEIDAPWMSKEHFKAESTAIEIGSSNKEAFDSNVSENENTYNTYDNTQQIIAENYDNKIDTTTQDTKQKSENTQFTKTRVSEAQLKSELKTKSLTEIKNTYSNSMHEIAQIILKNDVQYKNRIDDILDYLNCYSGKEIGLMAIGCSTPTISKLIQKLPEKAGDILDVVAPSMCFTGKQIIENIVEKGNNNEAA